MHSTCKNCNFKFEKEPGFFFGAMFISYALAVALFIPTFIISNFIFKLAPLQTFFIIVLIAFLSSTINFRLSRIIWIHLFCKK
nr:DUF983 domain-containing protein [uncultured Algibacter sp.]